MEIFLCEQCAVLEWRCMTLWFLRNINKHRRIYFRTVCCIGMEMHCQKSDAKENLENFPWIPCCPCCRGLAQFLATAAADDGGRILRCLCPLISGGVLNAMLPKPVDPVRMITYLPIACGVVLPAQLFPLCGAWTTTTNNNRQAASSGVRW